MEIGFAHRARDLLEQSGMDVEYRESDHAHWIEPAHVADAAAWLAETIP